MNRTEPIVGIGVRHRAQKYAKTAKRSAVWDETADAVPIGKRRTAQSESLTAPPSGHKRAGNPYRVRESLTRAGEKRAAETARNTSRTGTSPPRQKTVQAEAKTVSPHTDTLRKHPPRRDFTETSFAASSDTILNDDTLSEEERVADYRRAVRKKLLFKVRRIGGALAIACVFLVCALLLVYKVFYVIGDVSVSGTTLYTPETIVNAAGVSAGDNLYSFSSRVAQDGITLHCPYIRTLEVDRQAPDTVLFTVTEDKATFYAEIYGEIRALSPTLRVLDKISKEEAVSRGLICLCLPAVDEAVSGRVIALENERNARSIREIVSLVLSSSLRERITAIDLRVPHTLRMVADGQYLLNFGDTENVGVKLKVADAVLSDSLFSSGIKAQIDLTSTGETSVVLDDQLDLNW